VPDMGDDADAHLLGGPRGPKTRRIVPARAGQASQGNSLERTCFNRRLPSSYLVMTLASPERPADHDSDHTEHDHRNDDGPQTPSAQSCSEGRVPLVKRPRHVTALATCGIEVEIRCHNPLVISAHGRLQSRRLNLDPAITRSGSCTATFLKKDGWRPSRLNDSTQDTVVSCLNPRGEPASDAPDERRRRRCGPAHVGRVGTEDPNRLDPTRAGRVFQGKSLERR
jgi:hypothetical protein